MAEWGIWTEDREAVIRRAGGRRRYNHQRRGEALVRRWHVARLSLVWAETHPDPLQRGKGVWIARQLGVSEATISRDLAALDRLWRASLRRHEF